MPRLSKIGAAALAAFGWTGLNTVSATYLQVAGGGGGGAGDFGSGGGAGGGAGGYLTGTTTLNPTLSYTVIVGAGGAGGTYISAGNSGYQGSNSQFGTLTASVGGGYGAYGVNNGGDGGSGGGSTIGYSAGTGTVGQGNNGGVGSNTLDCRGAAGGGGASAVGSNGSASGGGNGGNGTASSITGSSVTYAGGGGGGALYRGGGYTVPTQTSGGTGGGGAGGTGTGGNGNPGTANLGGGGGGPVAVNAGTYTTGGNGGSGVVIISYLGAQQFGGGIVTSSGGYTIHTFNTSGTLSPISSLTADYLIVAGGGSSGYDLSGGGGAGGLLSGSGLTIDTNSSYLVTVGAGGNGVGSGSGNNGSNSSFSMVSTTAVGGGAGALYNNSGAAGGSGGGAGGNNTSSGTRTGGAATSGQGSAGGSSNIGSPSGGGGGGGAGAVGGTGTTSAGGAGGVGLTSSISGTSTYYAGGGGGGGYSPSGITAGAGGSGGGGTGGYTANQLGTAGTANTGGGAGGTAGGGAAATSAAGGSGIVIIRYAGSTQQMAGGSVTIAGGYVIHTFTSSGYLSPLTNFNNSLRFRNSASAYLSRTPTVTSNRRTWTYSAWHKRGLLSTQCAFFSESTSTTHFLQCVWDYSTNQIDFIEFDSSGPGIYFRLTTNASYRDPASWYHIVIAVDTTQSASSDRLKLYVNGVQVTSFSTATYPSQNFDTNWNLAGYPAYIGTTQYGGSLLNYYDGEMTNIRFIDGQQLTPNAFGAFNAYGVWTPVTYGGSYGTNGFYLPMNPGTSTYAGLVSNSNYLTTPNNAAFAIGTSDFTMETWFYPTSGSQTGQFFNVASGGIQFGYQSASAWGLCQANVAWQLTTSTLPNTNAWNHMAITRSGTNVALFMNGINLATATISTNYSQNTCVIAQGVVGYMSNTRIVKGTAVYNPANPTYTVPTSPLTNISGTSVLTFQNTTNIDNSSNAFTLTQTGTVYDYVAYPFNLNTVPDYSPSQNNWTANNIQPVGGGGNNALGSGGYGLDVLTDVPTLTSATVSNYCTFNPLYTGNGVTVTNGNLYATHGNGTTGWVSCATTIAIPPTGKWYIELTVQNYVNGYTGAGFYRDGSTQLQGNTASTGANNPNWWSQYGHDANFYNNSASTGGATTWGANTVISLAFDSDNGGKAYWAKNGVWMNSANPAANTGAPYTITRSAGQNVYFISEGYNNVQWTVNSGQQGFAFTPPTGFLGLNTYNI